MQVKHVAFFALINLIVKFTRRLLNIYDTYAPVITCTKCLIIRDMRYCWPAFISTGLRTNTQVRCPVLLYNNSDESTVNASNTYIMGYKKRPILITESAQYFGV